MTPGPKPAGYITAPPLLPFLPDRTGAEEETSVQVKRDQIGFTREQQNTFYPQTAERFAKFNFTLAENSGQSGSSALPGTGPAQMMEFFLAVAAPGASFWCPGSLQCLILSADALATDTVLNVVDTSAIAISDCIYIFVGSTAYARTITGLDPVHNTVTIDSAIGVAAPAVQTSIFPLILARLEKPVMKMTWLKPGLATVQLQLNEVPAEQLIPGDETPGITIGKLPRRVVLFQFTRDLGNGTVLNYYYTSFEQDIQWNGQTWVHAPFECGDITQTLNLQDDNVTITSYLFAGNPLIADLTKQAEAPLSVTIVFANYDGSVNNAVTMFTGDASAPARDGKKITMKCKMGPALLGSQLPIFLRGVQCSHLRGSNASGLNLISAGCTGPDTIMLRANWLATGAVASPLSAGFPYTLNLSGLTGVGANIAVALGTIGAVFANFFANGFVEWGVGANIQRRMIVGSTVPAGDTISLTLHRYFNGAPNIGDSINLYPGCDGLYTTCQAYNNATNPTGKFNNYQNFGGQPFTPMTNPSMAGLTQLGVQGTKK